MHHVHEASGLNPWTASHYRLRDALAAGELVEVQPQDEWRLPYLCSLLRQRREAFNLALDEEENNVTELINSLVAN